MKTRKRKAKSAGDVVADLFETDGAEQGRLDLEVEDRKEADSIGPQPPPHVHDDPRGDERAWESFPLNGECCSDCGHPQRRTSAGDVCKNGHGGAPPLGPGELPRDPSSIGERLSKSKTPTAFKSFKVQQKRGVRVTLREAEGLTLRRFDSRDTGTESLARSIVRVDAELRPSERSGFDVLSLRNALKDRGALGVVVAVRPIAEASEVREEIRSAQTPEEAIKAWFSELPNVPDDERAEALELSLRLLQSEG